MTDPLLPPTAPTLVAAAAWRGQRLLGVDDVSLAAALELARRNHVAGRLARVYPDRLADEVARVAAANRAMRDNLAAVAGRLRAAGVALPVLVKLDENADAEYGNFDLVTGEGSFDDVVRVLGDWSVHSSGHPLEPDKLLLHPASGPAAHLHRNLSWFGVDVLSADSLRSGAVPGRNGFPVPSAADALRSHIAHGCFQNLTVDLAELLTLRELMTAQSVAVARDGARAEGWGRSFDAAVAAARVAMQRLDAGLPPRLPVVLPVSAAARAGVEHGVALVRRGRVRMGVRELALRGPLLAAKRRRARMESGGRDDAVLLGISGPDGVGKTSVAEAILAEVERNHGTALRIHPYGCVGCRTLGRFASPPTPGETAREPGGPLKALHAVHGGVDVLEMALRVRFAQARLARRSRRVEREAGTPALSVVVTDRSPLDGLVKHAPRKARPVLRWFVRLAAGYDRLVCLDAPAATLAARDSDHSEAQIERHRAGFAGWSQHLPAVVVLPIADRRPEDIGAAMVASVLGTAAAE